MIDEKDTKTLDLVGDQPKKRGRPATGKARTPAQRKARSRRQMPTTDTGDFDYSAMSKTKLIGFLATSKVGAGSIQARAMVELGKRFGFIVTVTTTLEGEAWTFK